MNRALLRAAIGGAVAAWCNALAQVPLASPNLAFDDAGGIKTVAATPDGGYLIAGRFRSVQGGLRAGLAKISSTGSLAAGFDPAPDGTVKAIAVAGTGAFVAGDFTTIAGHARSRFARISTVDGALDPNFNPAPDVAPDAIAVDSSGNLYAAGDFASIGGVSGRKVVKLDPATGAADAAWNPTLVFTFDMSRTTLAVNGPWLYFGGKIACGQDGYSGTLRRISLSTGQVDATWTPSGAFFKGGNLSIAFDVGGDVFVSAQLNGSYEGECTFEASELRKINATTGANVPGFFPNSDSTMFPIAADATGLYAPKRSPTSIFGWQGGGNGEQVIARLDLVTGAVAATSAPFMGTTRALLPTSASLVAAIDGVVSVGGAASPGLVSLDKSSAAQLAGFSTRVLMPGYARQVAHAADGKIYVGGAFRAVAGVARDNLARLNSDGTLDVGWTGGVDGTVHSLMLHGNALYAGGYFAKAAGTQRQGAAKFDTSSGILDASWAPQLSDAARTMAGDENGIYLAGYFSMVNGSVQQGLARVSAASGALDTSFTPGIVFGNVFLYGVRSLAVAGNYLIAGSTGPVFQVGANTRSMARLYRSTGMVDSSWDPNPSGSVRALLVDGAYLYVGGGFSSIDGSARPMIARLFLAGGTLDFGWNAGAPATEIVFSLARSSAHVYAGASLNFASPTARRYALTDGTRDFGWAPSFGPPTVAGGGVFAASPSPDGTSMLFAFDAMTPREGLAAYATPLSDTPRLGNISTRMNVLTGNDVMIGGFVIGGSTSKTVAIVATGPSLAQFGIANPLANPSLTLVRSSDQSVVATNDDWQSHANASQLQAAGFAPSNPLEAGILVNLAPGAYTAIVQGAGGGTGVSVIGVYEVDGPAIPLINISTRGRVQTGDDVMIGGFVVQGTYPQTLAIVATGPSLAQFGIASPLANPKITLVRASDQSVVATNDDWSQDGNGLDLNLAGYAPSHPLESALYRKLPPGAYTVIVEGVGGGTGVAVIGVYKVQ